MKKRLCVTAFATYFLCTVSVQATDAQKQLTRALEKTKIDLYRAVEVAQNKVPGSRVLEAGLEWTAKSPYYEVLLLSGSAVQFMWVDPGTGNVTAADDSKRAERTSDERKACLAAQVPALKALKAAEESLGKGPLIGIEMFMLDAKPYYEVAGVRNNKVMKVRIDGIITRTSAPRAEHFPLVYWLFDDDQAGKPPVGFQFAETHPGKHPGAWTVTADSNAVSGQNVLTLKTSETESTFNVALLKDTSFSDLDLRLRLRADTGKEDQGGGAVWCAKDANSYYLCRLNPLEKNFRVYHVVDGNRTQLQSADVPARAGQWYRLRIVMTADHIVCLLDDKKLLDVRDKTIKGEGMIGLWTKADASSSFDNLVVYPPLPPD